MNKIEAMKNRSDITSHKEIGWDTDFNENNCSPETWAHLNSPMTERNMPYEEWLILYKERKRMGFKIPSVLDNIDDSNLPF